MSTLTLDELTDTDALAIRHWPAYPPALRELDYALREGGWLDQFPAGTTTRRFAARDNSALVGFSLLTHITAVDAEFYIALHPQQIGHGIGREIAQLTLQFGFERLRLRRIYLKVRKWHQRGIALYESIGFKNTGAITEAILGEPVQFYSMEILRAAHTGTPTTN
jgi:RimJ/RimL family protein N-acetyltransferase